MVFNLGTETILAADQPVAGAWTTSSAYEHHLTAVFIFPLSFNLIVIAKWKALLCAYEPRMNVKYC